MIDTPRFLQGVYSFEGQGLEKPLPMVPPVSYKVPFDKRAQLLYCRAGNSAAEMLYLLLKRDSKPMRYFPVAAKGATHVPLAVVEDLQPDSMIEVFVAAPEGIQGSIVLDIGIVEI